MFKYFTEQFVQIGNGLNYIFTTVICCAVISLVFNDKKWSKKNFWWKILGIVETWLINMVICSLVYWIYDLTGAGSPGPIMLITSWPATVIASCFINNKRLWFDRICKALTLSCFILIAFELSSVAGSLVVDYEKEYKILYYFSTLIVIIGHVLLGFLVSKYNIKDYRRVEPISIITLVSVDVCSFGFYSYLMIFQSDVLNNTLCKTLINIFLLIIVSLSYINFYIQIDKYNKNLDAQAKLLKAESLTDFAELSTLNAEDNRKLRHELKHQYGYMKTLLANGDYEQLNHFFSDMEEATMVPLSFVDVGNSIVSSALNSAIGQARLTNTKIVHSIAIPKKMNYISDVDLLSVVKNGLDNALEHIKQMKIEDGEVDINMSMRGDFLVINIENSFKDKDMSDREITNFQTWKADNKSHGFGTKITKELAKKYNGRYHYCIKNGKFCLDIMMLDKEATNEQPKNN